VRANLAGISAYSYSQKPERFPPPPAKPQAGKFIKWNNVGLTPLNPMAWLRMHNHGWQYGQNFCDRVFTKIQQLAFKSYGTQCGQDQIAYLTKDLTMDPHHQLKNFLRLVQAHSEAQAYYPTPGCLAQTNPTASEVGQIFTDDRKSQIVWNACYDLFKEELVNMNIHRRDDLRNYEELCKKFLLAEQHRKAKLEGKTIQDVHTGKNQKKKASKNCKDNERITSAKPTFSVAIVAKMGTSRSIATKTPTASTTKGDSVPKATAIHTKDSVAKSAIAPESQS
jgi:hypothetical protein